MDSQLRILILEDNPLDAELEEHELKKAGFEFTVRVVDTKETFLEALDNFLPDIILADYDLPTFNGLQALQIVKKKHLDVPFILVTGRVGEEFAIETLKEGVTDYVMKGNLKRLVPAMGRALEEIKLLEEKTLAKEQLRESEARYRDLYNNAPDMYYTLDNKGIIVDCNQTGSKMLGYKIEEIIGKHITDFFTENSMRLFEKSFPRLAQEESLQHVEREFIRKDGSTFFASLNIFAQFDQDGIFKGTKTIARDITQLKQAERELAIFKKFAEASSLAYGFADLNGDIIYVNPTLCRILGEEEREDALGKNIAIYYSESEKAKLLNEVLPTVRRKGDWSGELPLQSIKGKVTPTIQNVSLILDDNGAPLFIGNIIVDITGRKKAEEDIRKSAEKLRNIIEHSNELHYVHDTNHVLSYVSPQSSKILDYTPDEMMIEWTKLATDNPTNEKGIENTERAIATGKKQKPYLLELYKKDKTKVLLEIDESPLKDEQGNVVGIVGSARDVTQQKKAEDALRASEAELHDSYFAQSALNMILNESLKNVPFDQFLQKALDMILAIPWIAFKAMGSISLVEDKTDVLIMKAQSNIPEPLRELCLRVPFGQCICGKAALTQKIQFVDHIDGSHETCYKGITPHGHYAVPILSGGKTLGVLNIYLKEGHVGDQKEEEFLNTVANTLAAIIMQRKAEQEKEQLYGQLLQAQKMEAIGSLAGGVAHDFNNILTTIIGYGTLLDQKIRNDNRLSSYTKNILDSAERATNLTNSLLAFSRKQMISLKPINLNETVAGVEEMLRRLIREDIAFTANLPEDDISVMADKAQIEQILINLVTNARDAMPDGGSIFIQTGRVEIDNAFIKSHGYGKQGIYAHITVEDTGHGMDKKTREQIFHPFFTTKEVDKGTGLGLSMVYGLVKQHDGYVTCYSEVGKGSIFNIYLPLIESAEGIETKTEIQATLQGGTETILLAEDDTMVRLFLAELLRDFGYKVIEAVDGGEAIRVFKKTKDEIHLVVLDTIMPKKNGREVYDELRKVKPNIKHIFISGYDADIFHKQGFVADSLNFISKPILPNNFIRRVREVLDG